MSEPKTNIKELVKKCKSTFKKSKPELERMIDRQLKEDDLQAGRQSYKGSQRR